MMSHVLRRLSKLGPIMGNLVASATGCFVFTPGFRLVAMDEEGSDSESPVRVYGKSPGLSAGISAAIFLMVFITSEALATIVAHRR
jgi:lipid-binding SYLF domain-containing protein